MKIISRKSSVFSMIFIFGTCILMPQIFQYKRHIRNKVMTSWKDLKHQPNSIMASECLKHLKDKVVREKLKTAFEEDAETAMSVLLEYLHNCAHNPSKKFIAYFIKVLSNALEEYEDSVFEFEAPWTNRTHNSNKSLVNFCPLQSPLLQGRVVISFNDTGEISDGENIWNWPPTLEEVALEYHGQVEIGGRYAPSACKCRGYTAFIIPFRDRNRHLRFFLHYNHEILRRQQLCYILLVVEQDDDETFNKGQLMNTGFLYAKNISEDIDCFVFHDVDIISEDDRVIYTCRDGKTIHHIAPYINKYQYKFCCGVTVGAAIGFTREQFEDVNGFSNLYAGWGGEDDDMDIRIKFKNYDIWRSQRNYTRFMMVTHQKDAGNPDNENRMKLLENATSRLPYDGLTSLRTVITSVVRLPTHTRIKVKTFEASYSTL